MLMMRHSMGGITDAADDAPIIFAPPTRPTVWQMWCDRRPLLVGKPEFPLHAMKLHLLRSRLFKHVKIRVFGQSF